MKRAAIIGGVSLIVIVIFWRLNRDSGPPQAEQSSVSNITPSQDDALKKETPRESKSPLELASLKEKLETEIKPTFVAKNNTEKSTQLLSVLMHKYSKKVYISSRDLMYDLEALGLEPFKTIDGDDGNSLIIVRTHNTLPGTRYFHAQFFTDEEGREFIQHMSFEVKPSSDSFSRGVEVAKAYLAAPVESATSLKGYQLYQMSNGYSVYVKTLGPEDLEHPFNARTKEDIGTTRVVLEQEIHPPGDTSGHHQ